MKNITVIILTFNEELHIERCVKNALKFSKHIFVVDSFSTDKTIEIAEGLGAKVFQNPFVNQAVQFNWALDNLQINTEWVLRLDADEYLTEKLVEEIYKKVNTLPESVSGIVIPLRRVFLGREIKRGTGTIKLLRLFKYRKGRSEVRNMDEHIQLLEGKSIEFKYEFVDDNLNNLSWWTQKHNGYAIREAIDLLDIELGLLNSTSEKVQISEQAATKRRRKHKYVNQPLFWRSFAYFIYRYFFKLGFIEGKEGFLWHFLQGWWYRTLVDAKIWEIKRACGKDKVKIKAYIKKNHNIEL